MTKVKLISCLSVFALSLSMLVMGVLALATQTITLTGEVGFNIADKSVYVKDARISDETITGFMPGYINDGLILSDATISGSSFEISLDVINTTTNNFDLVIESSQSGVSVTTEAYIPANSTALTEITSSTPITETIVLTVTNSTSSPVDLTNILIKIEERTSISINAIASQTEYGNVSGNGEYDIGDIVTLTATESETGRFVEWRADSTTGNVVSSEETYEFELTASSPTTYYAIFEEYTATISVLTNNSGYGTVSGGGTYAVGDTVTLRASETSTGDFVNWRRYSSSGTSLSTSSTYTFTFTKDSPTTIYGYFQRYSVGVFAYSNNSDYGTVSGSGKIHYAGNTVTLTATPTSTGRFVEWRSGSTSGTVVSTSPTYTFTLRKTSPTRYYAIFEENYTILEGFTFNNLTSSTGELVSYTGTASSVEIPSSYSTKVIDGETVFIEGDTYTVVGIADGNSNATGAFYPARLTLRSVSIPDTVTSIGDYAFYGCSNLTTYNNPTRLNRIGEAAFMSCINLTTITIPSSVTSLGELAFANCQRITNINFNAQVPDYTSSQVSPFFNVGATTRDVSLTIGSNVNRIPSYFMNAESPNTARTYITEIVLSEGVEEIGFQAFRACNYMTSINIPLTMKRIERGAFVNNSNSLQVEFANTAGWYYTSSTTATTGGTLISASGLANPDVAADYLQVDYNNYYWNFNPQAIEDFTFNNLTLTTGELVSYTGSDAKVEIPGTYSTAIINGETVFVEGDTYTVTAIADGDMSPTSGITSAFYNNRTVTSVVIPDTVTRIGDYAFSNCNNLESVTMPDDLEEIGFRAFNACESLAGITFANSLQSIESYAFYGCTSLTTLTMPASLNTIGAHAFDGCTGLKKVTFEETSGWKAGTASLSANILNQLAYAYLTRNYVDVEWTRS